MSGLQYSGPVGKVWAVNGHPITSRRPAARTGDDWAGIEYTAPTGRLMRVEGRPLDSRQPGTIPTGNDEYARARRRYELAAERRRNPDHGCYGCAVPYNIRLPNDRDGDPPLWFDQDTMWILATDTLQLRTEHSGLVGTLTIDETRSGMNINGTVWGPFRKAVADRTALSPSLTVIDADPGPDGTLHVRTASLREVSLTRRPRWGPHTACHIWQRPAA